MNAPSRVRFTVSLFRGDAQTWWTHLERAGRDLPLLANWTAFAAKIISAFEPVDAEQLARDKLAHLHRRSIRSCEVLSFKFARTSAFAIQRLWKWR